MGLPFDQFRDGDLIFVDTKLSIFKPMTFLSAFIRNQERDFQYEHVCQWFSGKIYTTGAGGPLLWRYGTAGPEQYLESCGFCVGRYRNLSSGQVAILQETAISLVGSPYAWWKVLALDLKASISTGEVKRLGIFGKLNRKPKFVFCAGAVALGLMNAGIQPGGSKYNKLEPDAVDPRTLYDDENLEMVFSTKD